MSTAKFTTLSNLDASKTVPVDTVVSGSAKAWVNFNGTGTVAIRAAFNVSSITDNGTGDYTVNMTTALQDANYAVTGSSGGQASTSIGSIYQYDQATAKTTSLFRIAMVNSGGATVDTPQIAVAIFR